MLNCRILNTEIRLWFIALKLLYIIHVCYQHEMDVTAGGLSLVSICTTIYHGHDLCSDFEIK